jgi:TRAP-type C4-dicarboxylate transport system permease small subunit
LRSDLTVQRAASIAARCRCARRATSCIEAEMSAFERLYQAYGRMLRGFGVISAVATFVMMVLVVANVLGRYLLNQPLTGTLEFTESLLVVIIFLSLALTQFDGGHIRVTLLTRRLPKAWARGLTVFCMLCGAVFFAWCAFAAWKFAAQSWSFKEQEWGTVVFPLYPVKFIVFAGILLLAIQFLLDAIAETMMPIKADDERAMESI